MEQSKGQAELPPLPFEATIYAEALTDLGVVQSNGMGIGALPYAEIAAGAPWADGTDRKLIRDMSKAYLAGTQHGKDAFAIPPWDGMYE